ncbi:MAG TPA: hypothetical protein VMP67_07740 [Candidatus Limnocylindria bacterium]|nr:hypothetical protein [Candidatus Limnocylindria bacterium]
MSSLLAVAGGFSVSTAYLGSGAAALVACDPDGLTLGYTLDPAGRLSRAHVSGINPACAGGTVRVSLLAGSFVAGGGSASLPASGFDGSADVDLVDLPAASTITRVHLVVEDR